MLHTAAGVPRKSAVNLPPPCAKSRHTRYATWQRVVWALSGLLQLVCGAWPKPTWPSTMCMRALGAGSVAPAQADGGSANVSASSDVSPNGVDSPASMATSSAANSSASGAQEVPGAERPEAAAAAASLPALPPMSLLALRGHVVVATPRVLMVVNTSMALRSGVEEVALEALAPGGRAPRGGATGRGVSWPPRCPAAVLLCTCHQQRGLAANGRACVASVLQSCDKCNWW